MKRDLFNNREIYVSTFVSVQNCNNTKLPQFLSSSKETSTGFSVAKATLESRMSILPSFCQQAAPPHQKRKSIIPPSSLPKKHHPVYFVSSLTALLIEKMIKVIKVDIKQSSLSLILILK